MLLIILQKDISGDSEDESDNERQSDVSTPSYWQFFAGPHVTIAFEWAYKNRFRIGTSPWLVREEILKRPWCWLHIYWLSHIRVSPADSLHDEGMGSRYGKLSLTTLILNHWKFTHHYSTMGQYLSVTHHSLRRLILRTAGPHFIHIIDVPNRFLHLRLHLRHLVSLACPVI